MFSLQELTMFVKALALQEKSVLRLAAKDEQPDSVAAEYRKVATDIATLMRKVVAQMDALNTPVAVKK